MAPKFGTSGLRGLVVDLTDDLVQRYTKAFLQSCDTGGTIYLGWDLRPSSPDIARAVLQAAKSQDVRVIVAGAVPTPALALAAAQAQTGAIMITGSHIPADRNGLKFYTLTGEISKTDEGNILAGLPTEAMPPVGDAVLPEADSGALNGYMQRYTRAYGPEALSDLRIGVYQHSSVARDVMMEIVSALGGTPVALGRTETFTPVDTEAVDPETKTALKNWCEAHQLDAIISTDGDADRPMVAGADGAVILGDVLGAVTAQALGADTICTPVSSNTMIAAMPAFQTISLTRIGSPYVIAAMEAALAANPSEKVVGYEANGGFLLGYTAAGPAGPLAPLMTRDCLLPILACLSLARQQGGQLAAVTESLPQRFTAANRLTEIPMEASAKLIVELTQDVSARAAFFDTGAAETALDLTDGLRVSFASDEVVHLRPSGNAPELRCYAEAGSKLRAEDLVAKHLSKLTSMI
ncbi:phosphomannomutase [Cognatishimia sp. SS12]|uniref:phosphomannomutase n=1 Tax=Cognatishimia sp. SS12 TaxID=2979465 RepID=UPI00232B3DA1|nr:phosphomannomutase [Cognatishimia sp. SS12]MDC0739523.1 phosphomannomutase [Cognatishimia sp. SS12]